MISPQRQEVEGEQAAQPASGEGHMRILLADEQAKVRSALRLLLEQEPGLNVVGDTADAEALLTLTKETQPDLIILDWRIPGRQAAALLSSLREICPGVALLVLSGRPEKAQEALAAGADAFVSKGDSPERLLTALRSFTTH
jgi:DNA-binding NarL/FixJ family response regulator